MFNSNSVPQMMKSASSEDALKVLIENNAEEYEKYEQTKGKGTPDGDFTLKPKTVTVALHNPNEPANLRSNSFEIPLGKNKIE